MNRLSYLRRCIDSVRRNIGNLTYELVVVVGPSPDGSLTYLQGESAAGDLVVFQQRERTGAVKAFNLGCAQARGEYVAILNDDCEVDGDCLVRACSMLDDNADVGQVAIPFSLPNEPPHTDKVNLWGLRLVYANFGVIRRKLGNTLGWWGDHYQYAGDTELSIKVWNSNLKVMALPGGHIIHHQLNDDTRVPNVESRSLSAWNNAPMPALIREMRKSIPGLPTSENRKAHANQPVRPQRAGRLPRATKVAKVGSRIRTERVPYHGLPKPKRGSLVGVQGMTLIRYIGDGLIVGNTPSGTEYKFSGGACFYVDNRDLQYVFSKARAGESMRVI